MMKCDLRRGYCRDGRLPCDLCDCFLPLTRAMKRDSWAVHNYGGRIKFMCSHSSVSRKGRVDVPCGGGCPSINDNSPEEFLMAGTEVSAPGEGLVESKSTSVIQRQSRGFRRIERRVKESVNVFIQFVKELICKKYGHDWESYAYSTGYYPGDVEQAGHCERCHFDTHSRV